MTSTDVRHNMRATVQATLDGFNAPLDYDALRATRSDDFIYQFLPLSLGAPPRNNDEYKEFFLTQLKPLFQEFKVTAKSTMYDSEARKAVVYGVVEVVSVVGDMAQELVLMFSFNDAGDFVTRIDEFFDSAVYSAFFAKVQELEKQAADGV